MRSKRAQRDERYREALLQLGTKRPEFGVVGPSIWFSLCSNHTMNRLFDKKSKDSRKSSQRLVSLGIPTNVAIVPLGFRAELDIGPKGERCRPYRDLEADGPDPTVVPDEKDTRASRIVFQESKNEDQGLTATEIPTPVAVVGVTKHGNDTAGECFWSLPSRPMFIGVCSSPPEGHTRDTREGGSGPAETSKRTRRYQCFLLSADTYQIRRERMKTRRSRQLPPSFVSQRRP